MSTLKERRTWVKPVLNAKALHNTQDYHQTCHLSGATGQHKFLYRLLSLNNFGVSLHLEPCNFVTSKPVPNTSQCPELNLNALGVCKYRKLLVHHFECFRAKTRNSCEKGSMNCNFWQFPGIKLLLPFLRAIKCERCGWQQELVISCQFSFQVSH